MLLSSLISLTLKELIVMVKASTMQTPMVREVAFSLFLPSLDPFMREINILRSSQKKA